MAEETIALTDEQAVEYGFATASDSTAQTTQVEEVKTETPAVETSTETTPPVDKPAESVSPEKVVEKPPTESEKSLYTPEEVAQILKEEVRTGKVLLDSSRLTPEGQLLQKSFQQGYGPKFEQAKRMKEDAERIQAEIAKEKREAENKRLFDEDVERFDEETAKRNELERKRDERIAQLEFENRQVRQRESSLQIRNDYRQVAPKFHVPDEQVYEDIILSSIVAGDMLNMEGAPRTIEESSAKFADALGFTNINNLWKIIKANPENYTTVRNKFINEYNQEKAKGNTVSASSAANVQTPTKKPSGDVDPNKSTMDLIREEFGIPDGEKINLV